MYIEKNKKKDFDIYVHKKSQMRQTNGDKNSKPYKTQQKRHQKKTQMRQTNIEKQIVIYLCDPKIISPRFWDSSLRTPLRWAVSEFANH